MASFPKHLLDGYRTFTTQRLPTEQTRYRELSERGQSAALEYAVSVLRVKHIVVLGHAQCGGIRAFIDKIQPLSPGDFIGKWMQMFIKPGEVVEQRDHETMQDFTIRIEKAAVFRSLENLMTFPFVRERVERGEIDLHGAYFGVAEGSLFVLDQAAKEFRSVTEQLQTGE